MPATLAEGERWTATLECLSLLRLLALAEGTSTRSGVSADQAGHFLRKVLVLSLEYVFDRQTEASRTNADRHQMACGVMQFIAETIGYETLLEQLLEEIWRLLRQCPVQMTPLCILQPQQRQWSGLGTRIGRFHRWPR